MLIELSTSLLGKILKPFLCLQLALKSFAEHMGLDFLAPITADLYNKALAVKSRKIHKTGVNHFRKFAGQFPNINFIALPCPAPSASTLVLCFFAASLCLKSSINSSNTIRSYVRHIKDYWIQMGSDPACFESESWTVC